MSNFKKFTKPMQLMITNKIKRLQFLYGSIEIITKSLNVEKLDNEIREFDVETADAVMNTINDIMSERRQEITEISDSLRAIGYNGALGG